MKGAPAQVLPKRVTGGSHTLKSSKCNAFPELRFRATLGQEPEIELASSSGYVLASASRACVQGAFSWKFTARVQVLGPSPP